MDYVTYYDTTNQKHCESTDYLSTTNYQYTHIDAALCICCWTLDKMVHPIFVSVIALAYIGVRKPE